MPTIFIVLILLNLVSIGLNGRDLKNHPEMPDKMVNKKMVLIVFNLLCAIFLAVIA